MKGRIEKMPSVTNARVANVQKKSLERNAWKKAINAGSRRAASTVTMPLVTKRAATGHSQAPSGARRIANSAMSAIRKAPPQTMGTAPPPNPPPQRGGGLPSRQRGGGKNLRGGGGAWSLSAGTAVRGG